jgi:hypothetical protein
MGLPVEVMASQLAQDWEELMGVLWSGLAWTTLAVTLAVVLGSLVAGSRRALRTRHFWCPSIGRDVQVLFEEWGPPGFREVLRVAECSAFEPASAIVCRRACVDATCRRPAAPFGLSGMRAGAR